MNRVSHSSIAGPNIQIGSVTGDLSIALDRPDYRLDWLEPVAPAWLPRHQRTPSYLLDARRETVPFHPRPEVEARLSAWLADDSPRSVLLVHGAGGRGKTRLANAFATRAHAAGWSVAQATDQRTTAPAGVRGTRPDRVLVAVDYVERWAPDTLVEMVSALPRDFPGAAVRVLLLARSPASWPHLTARLDRVTDLEDPVELGDLTTPADRERAFAAAASAFRTALALPDRPTPPPDLAAYGSALLLHMAALAAVCADHDGDPRPDLADLSTYLLRHERRFWPPAAHDDTAATVFLATLFGPTPAGATLLARAGLPGHALARHARLYPEAPFAPLRPDRLGEDFVAAHLADSGADVLDRVLADGGLPMRQALIVLSAAAERHEHVRPVLWDLLPDHVRHATAPVIATLIAHAPVEVARAVGYRLPHFHVGLVQAATDLTRHLLEHADDPVARAAALNNLGLRLGDAGDPAGSVAAARESVAILRGLPDRHRHLNASLSNLALRLAKAGEHEEALAVAREAVAGARRIAAADPHHRPSLASALINLSAMLSDAGDVKNARLRGREAVTLLRTLSEEDSRHLPDLARALKNLGSYLAESGRKVEALGPAREAVRIWTALAEADGSTYLHSLARAHYALAEGQLRPGPPSRALAEADRSARTAVSIYLDLAEQQPALFTAAGLDAIRLSADVLEALGDHDSAAAIRDRLNRP